jgi:hypothetical protein
VKPCPRCLLNETNQTELYATILDYMNNIPDGQRTNDAEYKKRLAICKTCDHLLNGLCVLCGCYVQLRAAKVNQQCVKSVTGWVV